MNNSYLLAGAVVVIGGIVLYVATRPAAPNVQTGLNGSSQLSRDITNVFSGVAGPAASFINTLRNNPQPSSNWDTVTRGTNGANWGGDFVPDQPVFGTGALTL